MLNIEYVSVLKYKHLIEELSPSNDYIFYKSGYQPLSQLVLAY